MKTWRVRAAAAAVIVLLLALLLSAVFRRKPPAPPVVAPEPPKPRLDADGWPLPEFAIERLGSARARGNVRYLTFSKDGHTLIGTGKQTITLWDASTGKRQRVIHGAEPNISSLVISPDGTELVTGYDAGAIQAWNIESGELAHRFPGHKGRVNWLAFSADGKRMASAGSDKAVRLWDVATSTELLSHREHKGKVDCVALSPDGTKLASVGNNNEVVMWDVKGNARTLKFPCAPGIPCSESISVNRAQRVLCRVFFLQEGKTLAVASDRDYGLWDAETGEQKERFKKMVSWMAMAGDGSLALSHEHDGRSAWEKQRLSLWAPLTTSELKRLPALSQPDYMALSPDKKLAAWTLEDAFVLHDIVADKQLLQNDNETQAVTAVACSQDGRTLTAQGSDFRSWDTKTWRLQRHVRATELVQGRSFLKCVYASDGSKAVIHEGDRAKVWTTAGGEEPVTLGKDYRWTACRFAPDNASILACYGDGSIMAWNAANGNSFHRYDPQAGNKGRSSYHWEQSIACSADGQFFSIGCIDKTVRVFKRSTFDLVATASVDSYVNGANFSPDGKRIVSNTSMDGQVHIWEAATGDHAKSLRGHSGPVKSAAISHDGRLVVSIGEDGTTRVWDLRDGDELMKLRDSTGTPCSVALSKDGTRAFTGMDDTTVLVWDISKAREVLKLPPPPQPEF